LTGRWLNQGAKYDDVVDTELCCLPSLEVVYRSSRRQS